MKHPPLTPVVSSNVEAIGHEGSTLFVRFKGGGLYVYAGVPVETYQEGLASDSPGRWFRDKIRGKFKHEQHDE